MELSQEARVAAKWWADTLRHGAEWSNMSDDERWIALARDTQ